jgi:hypothetical protein
LRDGGTHFVCANPECPAYTEPIDADENAAANVGLRFLRGVDGIRATINESGKVVRSIGFVKPDTILFRSDNFDGSGDPYWAAASVSTNTSPRRSAKSLTPDAQSTEIDEDDSGGAFYLFRDPSDSFRRRDHWFERKVFWSAVARACASGIKAANASRFGADDED